MELTNFKVNDVVTYTPTQEIGTVTSVNSTFVFVRFHKYGFEHCTSHACAPKLLLLME